jgi:hypothetical protein
MPLPSRKFPAYSVKAQNFKAAELVLILLRLKSTFMIYAEIEINLWKALIFMDGKY